jgi:hypothetical protein
MLSYLDRHTRVLATALTGTLAAALTGCMVDAGQPTDLDLDLLEEERTLAGALGEQASALDTPGEMPGGPGEPRGKDAPAANRSGAVCDAALATCRAVNEASRAACRASCQRQFCNPTTGVCYVDVSVCSAECDRHQWPREVACLGDYVRCLAS